MAIEILKRERAALREKAKSWDARHKRDDGEVSVKTYNLLRKCAKITMAILALKALGLT